MENSELDNIIATVGKTLVLDQANFEKEARERSKNISANDIPYMQKKFHDPPPLPDGLDEKQFRLGVWMMACQYVCFELIYNIDPPALDFLRKIAFGEYDWTQPTALEILARLHVNGKLGEEIIAEINGKFSEMRFEALQYFARALLIRKRNDPRYQTIMDKLTDNNFREALKELTDTGKY